MDHPNSEEAPPTTQTNVLLYLDEAYIITETGNHLRIFTDSADREQFIINNEYVLRGTTAPDGAQ